MQSYKYNGLLLLFLKKYKIKLVNLILEENLPFKGKQLLPLTPSLACRLEAGSYKMVPSAESVP